MAEDAIRIAGTRVGIEIIIEDYQKGASPEEILLHYPTLSLEQIYATITYYLANPTEVEAHIAKVYQRQDEVLNEQQCHSSEFIRSLRQRLATQRQKNWQPQQQSFPKKQPNDFMPIYYETTFFIG